MARSAAGSWRGARVLGEGPVRPASVLEAAGGGEAAGNSGEGRGRAASLWDLVARGGGSGFGLGFAVACPPLYFVLFADTFFPRTAEAGRDTHFLEVLGVLGLGCVDVT